MNAPPDLPRHDHDVPAWVSRLLRQALEAGASDLHVEPQADGTLLRLRRHGVMGDWQRIPAAWAPRLAARIKVMAQLDLAERRLPQDGRLHDVAHGIGNIRVATLPTVHGEKLCLRLGEPGDAPDLDRLGLSTSARQALGHALQQPQGLILITGPTGAGKTTTLYACLAALDRHSRHIATVEDPVERLLPGINQTAVQPRIGLDFASVLRALLRQDPDVLMVGEIRDRETASMAVQAAETGHLVLTTLHAGSTVEALTRLRHLGIPDYQLADTVKLVMAQRLLRRLCARCRQPQAHMVLQAVAETSAHGPCMAQGCPACRDGHDGRVGIYELLPMDAALAAAWCAGLDSTGLQARMRAQGWPLLADEATRLWRRGEVSSDDILRVLGNRPAC